MTRSTKQAQHIRRRAHLTALLLLSSVVLLAVGIWIYFGMRDSEERWLREQNKKMLGGGSAIYSSRVDFVACERVGEGLDFVGPFTDFTQDLYPILRAKIHIDVSRPVGPMANKLVYRAKYSYLIHMQNTRSPRHRYTINPTESEMLRGGIEWAMEKGQDTYVLQKLIGSKQLHGPFPAVVEVHYASWNSALAASGVLFSLVPLSVAAFTGASALRARLRASRELCIRCAYPLPDSASAEPRCPECGTQW